jgi:hypothetical protein
MKNTISLLLVAILFGVFIAWMIFIAPYSGT